MNRLHRQTIALLAYPIFVAWPLLLTNFVLPAAWFPHQGLRAVVGEAVLFIICVGPVLTALTVLERKLPARADLRPSRLDVRTDGIHLVMGMFAYNPIANGVTKLLAVLCAARLSAMVGGSLWPTHWPLLAQVALAAVVGEFGQYWFHRLAHETEVLWRVHATHHGTPQVYWFNSTRFHAIETILKNLIQVGPLVIAGAPHNTLLAFGFFSAVHGWVQHSNVAYRTRAFDWLFATSRNHRWHHSTVLAEANRNYGTLLAVWDHVFRTFYSPRREFTSRIGIGEMPDFPKTYLAQMLSPFTWRSLPRVQPGLAGTVPAPIEAVVADATTPSREREIQSDATA